MLMKIARWEKVRQKVTEKEVDDYHTIETQEYKGMVDENGAGQQGDNERIQLDGY